MTIRACVETLAIEDCVSVSSAARRPVAVSSSTATEV